MGNEKAVYQDLGYAGLGQIGGQLPTIPRLRTARQVVRGTSPFVANQVAPVSPSLYRIEG